MASGYIIFSELQAEAFNRVLEALKAKGVSAYAIAAKYNNVYEQHLSNLRNRHKGGVWRTQVRAILEAVRQECAKSGVDFPEHMFVSYASHEKTLA